MTGLVRILVLFVGPKVFQLLWLSPAPSPPYHSSLQRASRSLVLIVALSWLRQPSSVCLCVGLSQFRLICCVAVDPASFVSFKNPSACFSPQSHFLHFLRPLQPKLRQAPALKTWALSVLLCLAAQVGPGHLILESIPHAHAPF